MSSSENRASKPRNQLEIEGIKVNFCKNPVCNNLGIPASTEKLGDGKKEG